MKSIFFALLVIGIFCSHYNFESDPEIAELLDDLRKHDLSDFEYDDIPENGREFLKGLLDGLGVIDDIKNFEKCIQNFNQIIEKLKAIVELLKKINIHNVKEVAAKLIEIGRAIGTLLAPCVKEGTVLAKILMLIKNANLAMIAKNILLHLPRFIEAAKLAITGVTSGNYYNAGVGLGRMLRIALGV